MSRRDIREALRNADRHGQPSVIDVRVASDGNTFTLTVENDGARDGRADLADYAARGTDVLAPAGPSGCRIRGVRPSCGGGTGRYHDERRTSAPEQAAARIHRSSAHAGGSPLTTSRRQARAGSLPRAPAAVRASSRACGGTSSRD